MRSSVFITLAAAICAYALPTAVQEANEQEYDVIVSKDANIKRVLAAIARKTDDEVVKQTYSNSYFKGFSGTFTKAEARRLRTIPGVEDVDLQIEVQMLDTRPQAPWGLQRISQGETMSGNPAQQTFSYSFSDAKLGEGVDIYIIDTGIRTSHEEFGGRARMGFTSTGVNTDDNGHGTHCAGTSAGSTVGVASKANLIGVKVLNGNGAGSSGAFIKGMDFVIQEHEKRSAQGDFVASIASMSLGFQGRQNAVEKALLAMSRAGIHASVASGNSGVDTCGSTPGSLGGQNSAVVSVGAMDISDTVAPFSNSGPCTDVYAPGVSVISSFNGGDDAYQVLDGTSMACPHVTGMMAFLLGSNGALSPAQLKAQIVGTSLPDLLKPSRGIIDGGDLIIANNGFSNGSNARFFRRNAYDGTRLY